MHVQALMMAAIPASVSSTPFVTGQSLSATLRNDGGGYWTGFQMAMGGTNITVTHLGRWKSSGDSNVHNMQVFSPDVFPLPVSGGSVNVDMSNTPDADGYVYAALATPIVLSSLITYQICSQENNGVDHFYQNDTTITTTTVGTVTFGFYWLNSTTYGTTLGPGTTYGPVNFKYHF